MMISAEYFLPPVSHSVSQSPVGITPTSLLSENLGFFSVGYIAACKTSRGFFSVAFSWWACAAFEIICTWSFGVVCEVSARLG